MNAIQQLQSDLLQHLPNANTELDVPLSSTGDWFLDVWYRGLFVAVQWRPSTQIFGIYFTLVYGSEGQELSEAYNTVEGVFERVLELLGQPKKESA